MKRKTATIERYRCRGTPRYHLRLTYRGLTLNYWQSGYSLWHDCVHYGDDSIEALKDAARKRGFTHVRFTGDWTCARKPKGGALGGAPIA